MKLDTTRRWVPFWAVLAFCAAAIPGLAQVTDSSSRTEIGPTVGTIRLPEEGHLTEKDVKPGAVILRYAATAPCTLSGFHVRLANGLGPTQEPVVAALRIRGERQAERATIPIFPFPLNLHTRTNGHTRPPLDVGQEYQTALAHPVALAPGDTVSVEIVSAGRSGGGVAAGLQLQGSWPLADLPRPFRAARAAGPVSRVSWSAREVICSGNQRKFDPLCAPQNNSGVVADEDGTLYQFTSYYSVDEQYGGGREGSYARIYGHRKRPDGAWENTGLVVDPTTAGLTYAGDPFAFRDLDGTPHLAYTTADGTNGFVDWKHIDGRILRSSTRSFAGPWQAAHTLYAGLPRMEGSDGRMIGIRIYPRAATRDYVLLWQHGQRDITVRGLILPDLRTTLDHEQIAAAPVLVRNQEEGGGGFQRDGKGYLSTWQIPSINDPTGVQRLYEFDLADPLNPGRWHVVPGSWGYNDGTNPIEDGGATADSWSLSLIGDDLWATLVVWSVSRQKNSVLTCHVPWERRQGDTFRFGGTKVARFSEINPVVEYAIGRQGSLALDFTSWGDQSHAYLLLAPADRSGREGAFGLELSDHGARLVSCPPGAPMKPLTSIGGPHWRAGRTFRLKLRRDGDALAAWVDRQFVGRVRLSEPADLDLLEEPQRFKLHGTGGGLYAIENAVLVDGPETESMDALPTVPID